MTQEQKDAIKEFVLTLVDEYLWVDADGEIGYTFTNNQYEDIHDLLIQYYENWV